MAGTTGRGTALAGTIVVIVHGIFLVLHGAAHQSLQVVPSKGQQVFIDVVIVAAPLVSAILLWVRLERAGLLLLFASMSGAFLFGVYYHFILVSSDNVLHLPAGAGRTEFQITAVAIAVIELAGVWVAVRGLKKQRRILLRTDLAA